MTAPGRALDVMGIAMKIHQAVIDHFDAGDNALPERRYLAPGSPETVAFDCAQFTTALDGVGWGPAPGTDVPSVKMGTQSNLAVRHMLLTLTIVRCSPTSQSVGRGTVKAPAAEQLQDAAEQFFLDAGMLSQAMVEIAKMIKTLDRTAIVQPGIIEPGPVEGAFQALDGVISITVGGLT